ncbi:MAG TPA: T9SS type A sorting domain-containing protein [Candidatus Kapabacteria bacterium]|nr:T9SS type A sorting domain-containing protein [Candidatus Kapabacteria bacterium]
MMDVSQGGADCLSDWQICYYWRKGACGAYQDFQIVFIRPLSEPTAGCVGAYQNMGNIFRAAVRVMLRDNPMNFDPLTRPDTGQPPKCASNWRVTVGTCWKVADPPRYGCQVCGTDVCCLAHYTVCLTSGGTRTWTPVPPVTGGQGTCAGQGAGCYPICDGLLVDEEYPKSTLKTGAGSPAANDIAGPEDGAAERSSAFPNPTSGGTTVICESHAAGLLSLTVYDAAGHVVLGEFREGRAGGSVEFGIDAGLLPSGAYRYTVERGSRVVSSGAFTVTR